MASQAKERTCPWHGVQIASLEDNRYRFECGCQYRLEGDVLIRGWLSVQTPPEPPQVMVQPIHPVSYHDPPVTHRTPDMMIGRALAGGRAFGASASVWGWGITYDEDEQQPPHTVLNISESLSNSDSGEENQSDAVPETEQQPPNNVLNILVLPPNSDSEEENQSNAVPELAPSVPFPIQTDNNNAENV